MNGLLYAVGSKHPAEVTSRDLRSRSSGEMTRREAETYATYCRGVRENASPAQPARIYTGTRPQTSPSPNEQTH